MSLEFFKKLLDRAGRKEAEKKNKMRMIGEGHRGVAIGNASNPDLSAENVSSWEKLSAEQVYDFIYEGDLLFVHSSNVAAAQYHIKSQKIMIEFNNGYAYLVSPFTEQDAINFAKIMSKGSYYWDAVRIRGTKYGHKRNVQRVR